MKKTLSVILTAIIAFTAMEAKNNAGTVIYSLPSTTIRLEVETLSESFTPGAYCQYAQKYLGIEVPQKAKNSHKIMNIRMLPYIEADRTVSHIANLEKISEKAAAANFLQLTSQGLILLSDENKGKEEYWRFPSMANTGINTSEATDNLTSTETTLYRTRRNESGGYDKVAMKQSQVVEKSLESKAKEAAALILSLRTRRLEIITGDTDATFSGEALQAAVDEIGRMENELMELFIGKTVSAVQKQSFDIVPSVSNESEMKIAFRISDNDGLLSPDNVAGRPIVIEITPENASGTDQDIAGTAGWSSRPKQGEVFYYRIPSICTVDLIDGQKHLMQSRIPVYQKGQTLSFPISVLIK